MLAGPAAWPTRRGEPRTPGGATDAGAGGAGIADPAAQSEGVGRRGALGAAGGLRSWRASWRGTLDTAAAAKLLASAAAEAKALATEVATAYATLSRLSAFASAVDPAALHGGLAARGAAAAAAWGAVVRSSAGEVLSGGTLGSGTAALLGRLATPVLEVLHEAHLATRDDEPGGWSAWLHATRSESVDRPEEEAPTQASASLYFFGTSLAASLPWRRATCSCPHARGAGRTRGSTRPPRY